MKAENVFQDYRHILQTGSGNECSDIVKKDGDKPYFIFKNKNEQIKFELEESLTQAIRFHTKTEIIIVRERIQDEPSFQSASRWYLIQDGKKREFIVVELDLDKKMLEIFELRPRIVKMVWTEEEEKQKKPMVSFFVNELTNELVKQPEYRLHMVTGDIHIKYPRRGELNI